MRERGAGRERIAERGHNEGATEKGRPLANRVSRPCGIKEEPPVSGDGAVQNSGGVKGGSSRQGNGGPGSTMEEDQARADLRPGNRQRLIEPCEKKKKKSKNLITNNEGKGLKERTKRPDPVSTRSGKKRGDSRQKIHGDQVENRKKSKD